MINEGDFFCISNGKYIKYNCYALYLMEDF